MSDTSNSATLQLLGLGSRLGRWMRICVSALIADLSAGRSGAARCRSLIAVGDNTTEIFERDKSGDWRRIARLEGGPGENGTALKAQLKRHSRQHVLLRIGDSRALIKRLSLPAAAADVLPAIVRNKVESLAPWPLQEAMWGERVLEPQQDGQIEIEVGIVSRKTIQGLMTSMAAVGVNADYLEISSTGDTKDGIGVDILGADRSRGVRRTIAGLMSLAAVAALAVAGYGGVSAYSAQSHLWSVEARIEELTQSLRGTDNGNGPAAKLKAANGLYHRKLDGRPTVVVLNELTRRLPDGTWLTSLDLGESKITVNGRGTGIPRIIESLESSDVFSATNFASATQRDEQAESDTFSISATVDGGGAIP